MIGQIAGFTDNARERRETLRIQLSMAEEFVERLELIIAETEHPEAPAPS